MFSLNFKADINGAMLETTFLNAFYWKIFLLYIDLNFTEIRP